MGFSLIPREDAYFTMFSQMTGIINQAAEVLIKMTRSSKEDFGTYAKEIKGLEHACDELTHSVTTKLNKSFITPFDREDIYALITSLDDIADYIDASARAIMMYNINEINAHIQQFADIIHKLTVELHNAVLTLERPKDISRHIIEIHNLENQADDVYFQAIGELFQNNTEPITVIKYKELYELLESANDMCEAAANIIESIILKHN